MVATSRTQLLESLGPLWQQRQASPSNLSQTVPIEPVIISMPADAGALSATSTAWETLAQQVKNCQRCGLCRTRTQTVFAAGSRHAKWLFIGEAPGADEDAQGFPFVGQAGRLLDNLLRSLGLDRHAENLHQAVYIANVLKCRPPNNRNPAPDEVALCSPYLQQQIELVRPAIIVLLGKFAAQTILQTEASISSLRGRQHTYTLADGTCVPVVVTYHPAYLLRSLADKNKAWADLCLARSLRQQVDQA